MNKNKIILFDLDGTLIDSTDAIVSTFYHSFKELNFDFKGNDEDIKSLIGYPLDIMYKNLGVNDYGIYSVVGGVVVILAFLNNAMVATTQRYLSFNLKDQNKIIEIFRISKTIHLFVALIVFIVAETFGLYFVNHFLNFDAMDETFEQI